MIYVCCDERRRDAVRAHRTLNGIDFLEVLDDLTLVVHFLKPLGGGAVTREQVRIEGGERVLCAGQDPFRDAAFHITEETRITSHPTHHESGKEETKH